MSLGRAGPLSRHGWQAFAALVVLMVLFQPLSVPLALLKPRPAIVPENVQTVIGEISIPSTWSRDWEGYDLVAKDGSSVQLHCGPTSSLDYCLHKKIDERDGVVPVSVEYYVDKSSGSPRNVILSAAREGVELISRRDQLRSWSSSIKVYNTRRGKYILQEPSVFHWSIYAIMSIVGLVALFVLGRSLVAVAKVFLIGGMR